MLVEFSPFKMLITPYILLMLSIIALFCCKNRMIALGIFVTSLLTALYFERINIIGIAVITAYGVLSYVYFEGNVSKLWKFLILSMLTVISILLFIHLMPGFNNYKIIDSIRLNQNSVPYSLWLNLDKPIIGFFILLFVLGTLVRTEQWKQIIIEVLKHAAILLAILIPTALLSGFVALDIKLPNFTLLWIAINLLFVCAAEEALFRYLIQHNLTNTLKSYKYGIVIAITISAILFGLFHYALGLYFVLFAMVAGFFYGHIYYKTGRIESAIVLHFLINLVHFIGFSYPYIETL